MKLLALIVALSVLLAVASAGHIRRGWSSPVVYSYRPVYSSGWSGGSGWRSGGSGYHGSGWRGSSGWSGGYGGWSGGSRGYRGGWW